MFKKQKATKFFRASALSPASKMRAFSEKGVSDEIKGRSKAKKKAAARKGFETREVAVWDIDAHSGYLNRVLDAINQRQRLFKFARIEATVPMGLTMSGSRTREIVKKHGGDFNSSAIGHNVLAEDVYRTAQPILESLFDTDLLVCVLAPMIMDYLTEEEDGKNGIELDFFSVSKERIALVSAFGLRDYAKKAKRPFEACLATLIVAQVFAETFSDVGMHDDTRGCIMDYCDNRNDVIQSLRKIEFCPETLSQIPAGARASALKILDAIREYEP